MFGRGGFQGAISLAEITGECRKELWNILDPDEGDPKLSDEDVYNYIIQRCTGDLTALKDPEVRNSYARKHLEGLIEATTVCCSQELQNIQERVFDWLRDEVKTLDSSLITAINRDLVLMGVDLQFNAE